MTRSAESTALFLCDQPNTAPEADARSSQRVERLTTIADDGLSNLQLDSIGSRLGSAVPPIAEDLLYIAAYCVAADQLVDRGSRAIDVHRDRWRRQMEMVIPVSDPAFWARPAITEALERALDFATADAWHFHFTQRPPTGPIQLRINAVDDRTGMGDPDCVVLVSGGTDSLCTLVEAIGVTGRRPIAVSHRPAHQIDRWQRDLLSEVRKVFPHWTLPHLSFTMHRRGTGDADPSQRTRPFLYAALGTAIAATLGIDQVMLADNGYVSVNPPISRELAGTLASRGTHPTLLRLLTALNTELFDQPIRVENPLAHRTRAEALMTLRDLGGAHLLALTHTCGNHRGRPRTQPHCGTCSQCVDRRFAVLAAGLEQDDPASHYGQDIFTADLPAGSARKIAWLYRTFARQSLDLDDDALLNAYPELLATMDPDDPMSLLPVLDLLRRHAQEVLEVMAQQIVTHSRALARGTLPATCLLRVDDTTTPEVRNPTTDALSPPLVVVPPTNTIEETTHVYRLTFHGERGEVPKAKGMKQLMRLLTAPHQEVSAIDLAHDTRPGSTPPPELVATDGWHQGHTADPVIDTQARAAYLMRARELEAQLEGEITDNEREVVRGELEFIAEELERATGLSGRTRDQSRELENARTSVNKNITKVLTVLESTLPSLHDHLRHTLHLGYTCSYTPDDQTSWRRAS